MFISTNKNPKYNSNINPKYNANINPKYNANINPKYNANINPKYNANINPKYNANINPRYNSNINPRYNSNLNPKINSNINPRYNTNINPKINSNFNGLLIFDLESNPLEFIVQVNSQFIQIFDFSFNNSCFGVAHSAGGYCLFTSENIFIGHLESDSQQGYNKFDETSTWLGFIK